MKRSNIVVCAGLALALVSAGAVHAGTCIISGETNRTCVTTTERSMTGTLDSFWRSRGATCFEKRFRTRPTGLLIFFR